MTTIAIQPIAATTVNPAGATPAAAPARTPNPAEIARFESRMDAQALENPQTANQTPPEIHTPDTLGDVILQGMENLNDSRDVRIQRVTDLVNGMGEKPITIADGMRLQLELMQLNLHHEVTTKTADKTSQGVQTLFRNQ